MIGQSTIKGTSVASPIQVFYHKQCPSVTVQCCYRQKKLGLHGDQVPRYNLVSINCPPEMHAEAAPRFKPCFQLKGRLSSVQARQSASHVPLFVSRWLLFWRTCRLAPLVRVIAPRKSGMHPTPWQIMQGARLILFFCQLQGLKRTVLGPS
jgi:hypothetical protein